MVADGIEERQHLFGDLAAAGNEKADAVSEHLLADLAEGNAAEQLAQNGNISDLLGNGHSLSEFFDRLLAAFVDFLHCLIVHALPKQRHGKNMGDAVAANGIQNRLRRKIVELNEGARKKRKPDIHRRQPEHMVKRQER